MSGGSDNFFLHIIDVLFNMIWQIYWPLAFGLMLSAFIRHLLPMDTVVKHLGHTSPRSLTFTTLLGVVSSSCSYAAASMSHTLIMKKSTLANAMAFLVSSTNLIVEMFIVLVALLGWTFFWGEVIGGLILIMTVAFLFERFFPKDVEAELREKVAAEEKPQAAAMSDCGMDMSGSSGHDHMAMDHSAHDHAHMHHEGHDHMHMEHGSDEHHEHQDMKHVAEDAHEHHHVEMEHADCGMDMSGGAGHGGHDHMHMENSANAQDDDSTKAKITKAASFFHMDIGMIGKEILIGVVVSSLLIAIVPMDGWRTLFISNDTALPAFLHSFIDVVIGVFVAMIAYVCSVGNLLLAAALWHGGISFGGVIGFILADVLTIPMIRVYQRYYGNRPTKWIVGLLFAGIVFTGLAIDAIFTGFGVAVSSDNLRPLIQDGFGWNFTTVMNLIFIPLSFWFYQVGKKANAGMGMSM
ncbi:permease [Enterovibrio paralichthyis]|uniref:permease n=1 Tax=Enterovibrio paralichthyis TaxID=2853805 RepID=UPI001C449C69|nr:permease [Enterovibrio paralichthyis]MBV7299194.1 permease [Enterovibrio paralichthyis]